MNAKIRFLAVLVALAAIQGRIRALPDGEPGAILLAGSTVHPDSIDRPDDGTVVAEDLLNRYLTTGNSQIVLERNKGTGQAWFRVFTVSRNGLEISYGGTGGEGALVADLSGSILPDTVPPVAIAMQPAPGGTEIPVQPEFFLILSEAVQKDSGSIGLLEDDSLILLLDVSDSSVQVYSDTVRLLLPPLRRNTPYRIELNGSCFRDLEGNPMLRPEPSGGWQFSTISRDLYISEYVKGTGYLKGFELFNPREDSVHLDDYRIHYARNGSGYAYVYEFPEGTGVPPSGRYAVLNRDLAGLDSLDLASRCAIDSPASSVVTFTGNDALALEKTTNGGRTWYIIDAFGHPDSSADFDVAGIRGASSDHTLMRKDFIVMGNPDWSASAGTGPFDSEWKVFPVNYFDNLGLASWPSSGEAEIISFSLPGHTGHIDIDPDSSLIVARLLYGVPPDSVVPLITTSEFAWMAPPVAVYADTGTLTYRVIAEDRSTFKDWRVEIVPPFAVSVTTLRALRDSMDRYEFLRFEGTARVTALHDSLVFIQDSTAGMALYRNSPALDGIQSGTTITRFGGGPRRFEGIGCIGLDGAPVTGTGLPEDVPPLELLVRDVAGHPDEFRSMLISLRNVAFSGFGGTFNEGTAEAVHQGSDTAWCRVDFFGNGLSGLAVPAFGGLTGILISTDQGSFIAPRSADDLTVQSGDFRLADVPKLTIVPNPGNGTFTIPAGHGMNGPAKATVYDLSGTPVLETLFDEVSSTELVIHLEEAAPGTYILFLANGDYLYVSLLIKAG